MRSFYPLIFAIVFILFVGAIEIALLRLLNRVWWEKSMIRRAAMGLPLFGSFMVLIWGIAEYHTISWLAFVGAILAVGAFVLEVCLMLSLPVSGVLHLVQTLMDFFSGKRKEEESSPVDQKRRSFLKAAAAAIPAITLASGVSGVTQSFGTIQVYRRKIYLENLPEELEGLKIFHLSDSHLRNYVTLDDLVEVLTAAEPHSPDLTLVTGDIADDLGQLPEALTLIDNLNSPLGAFACLGNHEYFRGIEKVHRIFEKSAVPLLVDGAAVVSVKGVKLMIAATDDPVRMGSKNLKFFRNSIDYILARQPLGDFSILMSHRPDSLDYAAEKKFNLVLAGHTHGGQIGFMGRSVFESLWPDRYLWGEYAMGKTKLYTSSGVGHWFPFRLGCPREAPVLELHRV